jgi:hypothetical protein
MGFAVFSVTFLTDCVPVASGNVSTAKPDEESAGCIDAAATKRRKIAAHGVSVGSDFTMASREGAKESFAGERKRI